MKHFRIVLFLACLVYCALLLRLEWTTDQDQVRPYFTDIARTDARFYAINTTLSVSLLWGASLLFAVGFASAGNLPWTSRTRLFDLSQVLAFAVLGFDDRFGFHEWAAYHLGIDDHFILILIALAELGCLLFLGGAGVWNHASKWNLVPGSAFFLLMLFIDAFGGEHAPLRLSSEDLAKFWGTLFFFLFAWDHCLRRIRESASHPPMG